ncbi:MAG: response regulator [Candidatus Buchananbacteria bacterium]
MAKEEKKIILMVEDDEVLLRALYLIFHEGGFTLATATDGETALRMAERTKPDVILLDLLLPKMNGFDFLKNIKANPALRAIPVIVLSNLGDDDSIKKAKDLGAADYFIKADTDLSALKDKVKKILNV